MRAQERLGGWPLVGYAAIAVALACALTLALFGTDEAGIRAVIRLTARISAVLFSLAFAARAANRIWGGPRSRWLLRHRRYVGVSFAVSHTFHLAALVWLAQVIGGSRLLAESGALGVGGGAFGYLFVYAMVATSFDRTAAWLGRRRWKLLHTSGMYVLAGIFLFTYAGAAATGNPLSLAFLLVLVGATALRFMARSRTRTGTPR